MKKNKSVFLVFRPLFIFILSFAAVGALPVLSGPVCLLSETLSGKMEKDATVVFRRVQEPKEKSFSLLIPKGWHTEGGIFRIDPLAQGGAAQSIAAKVDFSVKKDRQGKVMIRWLPDMLYFDMRYSPAGQMGLFPNGSNYNGMTVFPLMSAEQFISRIAFPYAHPQAANIRIVAKKKLPKLEQKYLQFTRRTAPQLTMSYDAALLTVTYSEGGIRYKEKMIAVIENWGQLGAGLWGNKETFYLRAPVAQFEKWQRTFSIIQGSVNINPQWLRGEISGQMQRNKVMLQVMRDSRQIERSIVEHRQKTNAEIHNDMFLTLTDQEEYVNPFTKEVEIGSNQWKYRWTNPNGDVIYTDKEEYDPRVDVRLNRNDYKRTPIRKRFPR